MSSVRTVVRDKIVTEFTAMQTGQNGRVVEFDVNTKWLTDTETKRGATYCVVVTEESRAAHNLLSDIYTMSGVVVIYAYDTADARAKLDLMIEDAIDVLRRAFRALQGTITRAMLDGIQVSEGGTAEGDWPQAVVRWNVLHTRPVLV